MVWPLVNFSRLREQLHLKFRSADCRAKHRVRLTGEPFEKFWQFYRFSDIFRLESLLRKCHLSMANSTNRRNDSFKQMSIKFRHKLFSVLVLGPLAKQIDASDLLKQETPRQYNDSMTCRASSRVRRGNEATKLGLIDEPTVCLR
jgi:hypothetical protein